MLSIISSFHTLILSFPVLISLNHVQRYQTYHPLKQHNSYSFTCIAITLCQTSHAFVFMFLIHLISCSHTQCNLVHSSPMQSHAFKSIHSSPMQSHAMPSPPCIHFHVSHILCFMHSHPMQFHAFISMRHNHAICLHAFNAMLISYNSPMVNPCHIPQLTHQQE